MGHPHCINNIKVHSDILMYCSIVQHDSQRGCLVFSLLVFFLLDLIWVQGGQSKFVVCAVHSNSVKKKLTFRSHCPHLKLVN